MSKIGSRRTAPERHVARALRERRLVGWRRDRKVGGVELDFVWPRLQVAINVHGCFWHGHDCGRARIPKSHHSYWQAKLAGNVERDARQLEVLMENGWTVFIIWECDLKTPSFARTMDLLGERLGTR